MADNDELGIGFDNDLWEDSEELAFLPEGDVIDDELRLSSEAEPGGPATSDPPSVSDDHDGD